MHSDARSLSIHLSYALINLTRTVERIRRSQQLPHAQPTASRTYSVSLGPWTRAGSGNFVIVPYRASLFTEGKETPTSLSQLPSALLTPLSSYSFTNSQRTCSIQLDELFFSGDMRGPSCSYRFGHLRKIDARRPRARDLLCFVRSSVESVVEWGKGSVLCG